MTKRDKRPTKRSAAGSLDWPSSAKRRGEAEQKGAPPRAKKTRDLIEALGSQSGPASHARSVAVRTRISPEISFIRLQSPDYCVSDQQLNAVLAAMTAMQPADALEGMVSAQLVAIHHAAMACYRRAAIDGQSFDGWRESLNQASKLSRTFAALTEALDRRRGKRQQRITVEHVHVHAGGQAIVGSVTAGVPGQQKLADQSNATRELADEPSIPLRGHDAVRETVPVANGSRKAPV